MLELTEMTTQHVESVEAAIAATDRLLWNITFVEDKGRQIVFAGDQALLVTDNREVAEAFVYGMGLAYSVIPEHFTKAFVAEMGLAEEYADYLRERKQAKEGGN